jgi:hypothetical protein
MNSLLLLLRLKLKLVGRTFTRRPKGSAGLTIFATVAITLAFLPMWVGVMMAAYFGARTLGPAAVAAGMGMVHVGWMAGTLLLASFAEGIDVRALLRYPVRPRSVFWLNVLVAPIDLVALFLIPPLGALAAGTAVRSGTAAGLAVAAAGLALLLITSAVSQTALAALGRYLRREWTRAIFGLLLGLVFMIPSLMARGMGGGRGPGGMPPALTRHLPEVQSVFAWFPPTALPVRAAGAAAQGRWLLAAGYLFAAGLLLVAIVHLGAHIAVREAMNRGIPADTGRASAVTGAAAAPPRTRGWLARLSPLPPDLGALVTREWRVFLRTPQVLMGLFMMPVVLLFLGRSHTMPASARPFLLTFLCLASALNLSSNQFGLDHAGVRMLFLLPISSRRLLQAKNLALIVLVSAMTVINLPVAAFIPARLDGPSAVTTVAMIAAALPVVLTLGNFMSIHNPWRMVFRIGGAPPGAMVAAFAQFAALGFVALLLLPGLIVIPTVMAGSPWARAASLASIAFTALVLWAVWALALGRAARTLDGRREFMIDRLARATEIG